MPNVELMEYSCTWPDRFGVVAGELASAMAGVAVVLEHIGSTAVPGLCAKPVIDVLMGVGDLDGVHRRVEDLAQLGYEYRPTYEAQIPERRYFVRSASEALPRVHVHGVRRGGRLWTDHLAFRDALRADADLRQRYAALKRSLAEGLDKGAYTEAKGPFIQDVLMSLKASRPRPGQVLRPA